MATPTAKQILTIVKQTVAKVIEGKDVHKSWDGLFGADLAEALFKEGYVYDRNVYSTCKVAFGEWHLAPGKKHPGGKRVEIITSSFLGVFTQVSTRD